MSINKTIINVSAVVALATLSFNHAAFAASDDQRLTLSTGFDRSSGKYGSDQSTDITYVPFALKYEGKSATLKLTVPYLRITGPANVVGGIDSSPIVVANGNAPRRTVSGLGDAVVSVGTPVYSSRTAVIDLVGKVKLPTADENKGLGTGKADYAVQVDGFRTFQKTSVFSTLGYRVMGDPDGINFRNVPYGSLGALYKVSNGVSVGAAFDTKRAVIAGRDPQKEFSLLGSFAIDTNTKLQGYLVKGQGNSSPDYSVGAVISQAF